MTDEKKIEEILRKSYCETSDEHDNYIDERIESEKIAAKKIVKLIGAAHQSGYEEGYKKAAEEILDKLSKDIIIFCFNQGENGVVSIHELNCMIKELRQKYLGEKE